MEKNTRSQTIDILRGIGIVLVVLGHGIQFANGAAYRNSGQVFEDPIFRLIYGFHMPFFLLLGGFLASYSLTAHTWREEICRKFLQLGIPIAVWGTIEFVCKCATEGFELSPHLFVSWVRFCLTNNWFLWAVLVSYAVVGIGHYALRDHWLYYAAVLALMFVTTDDFNLKLCKYVFPFFLISYLYGRYYKGRVGRNIAGGNRTSIACAAAVTVYLVLFQGFHTDEYIYISGFTVLGKGSALQQIALDLYRFVLGLAGSLALVLIVNVRERMPSPRMERTSGIWAAVRKVLIRFGQHSIGIYLISGVLFQYAFRYLAAWDFSYLRTLAVTAVMLAGCDAVYSLVCRNKGAALLLFGRS